VSGSAKKPLGRAQCPEQPPGTGLGASLHRPVHSVERFVHTLTVRVAGRRQREPLSGLRFSPANQYHSSMRTSPTASLRALVTWK
jgi:hypothetical protein